MKPRRALDRPGLPGRRGQVSLPGRLGLVSLPGRLGLLSLGLLSLGLPGLVGCRTAPPPRPDAVLWLRVTPPAPLLMVAQPAPRIMTSPDALVGPTPPGLMVYIDDQPVPYPPRGAALRAPLFSGPHRVEVRLPGYFSAYRDVTVPHTGERLLHVVLRPDPDATPGPAATSGPAATPPGAGPRDLPAPLGAR